MKISTVVLLFSLCFNSFLIAQSLEEFSELSNTETALYNSVKTESGIIYYISELPSNRLVKVDWSGNITHDVLLPFTDSLYFNGQLVVGGDKVYLVGHQRLYPNVEGTNSAEVWASQKRAIMEINSDLTIEETYLFDIIPFGAGEVVGQSGAYVGTNYPSSISIKGNKIRAAWAYIIYDTQTPIPSIIGNYYQYEQIDLDTNDAEVQPLGDATMLIDALFMEDDFLIYGEVADTIVNGIPFNQRPVGRYSNTGEKMEAYFFDEVGSGAFSDGSIGTIHEGLLYSAYFGRSVDSEGCVEDNTTVDVRDTNFNLINRVKLPDCDLFPYGKNSFAFVSTGEFYFHAAGGGKIALYKFDSDLNVLCSEVFAMPTETPISLTITPDDELVLETLFNMQEMRLYSFACEADQTSLADEVIDTPKITIFPNPTSEEFYVQGEGENDFIIEVSSILGQSLLQNRTNETGISLSDFSAGIYLVKIFDKRTGELIKQEKLLKL